MNLKIRANRTQGWLARAGWITIDDSAFTFTPERSEAQLGSKSLSLALDDIVAIEVAPRDLHLMNGGLRRRLRVQSTDGTSHLFVVGEPDQVATIIRKAVFKE